MAESFPTEWLIEPLRILVAGDGCYASVLAAVLGAGRIGGGALAESLGNEIGAAMPQVLGGLEMVFLVCGAGQAAAGILSMHRGVWERVDHLSAERDEHQLAIIFVLPECGDRLEESLALGLGLTTMNPATCGHAVVRMSDPLGKILAKAAQTVPRDAVVLHNRLLADRRHRALVGLKMAAPDDLAALQSAAAEVLEAFHEREYDLDLFCLPPCHPNGNAVRGLLQRAVTHMVTPEEWEEMLAKLS